MPALALPYSKHLIYYDSNAAGLQSFFTTGKSKLWKMIDLSISRKPGMLVEIRARALLSRTK